MAKTSVLILLAMLAVPTARADSFQMDLLARAEPDEIRADGIVKVNHNCIWGMASSQGLLWFGDVGGKSCMAAASQPDNVIFGQANDPSVCICEFAASTYAGIPADLPPALRNLVGDWRPPDVYRYDPAANALEKRTPDDPRIQLTLGLRAAGATDRIVFLGGPHLYVPGINLFAFDAKTGLFLGSATFPQYSNIRRWVLAKRALYTAVENTDGGGSVLRWTGTLRDPFRFEVVGTLDAAGAYIAEHDGRLFVTTWPQGKGPTTTLGGLWMSPPFGRSGLRAANAGQWQKVWDIGSYQPDPLIAPFCGGGALASYGGHLYWGTMAGPGQVHDVLVKRYGESVDTTETLANSSPATAIFRGSRFGSPRARIDLLYGETQLPVFIPGRGWQLRPNGYASATFGPAGFGNPFNAYAWSMAVHDGRLFVGTYDWNIMIRADEVVRGLPVPEGLGGDLYSFTDVSSPAVAVSVDGAGNVYNNGFRNLHPIGEFLYIGTGNISNLRDLPGAEGRGGGWELLRLKSR